MYYVRIIVLVLSTIFAAVNIVSIFFPIFRRTVDGPSFQSEVYWDRMWTRIHTNLEWEKPIYTQIEYSTLKMNCSDNPVFFTTLVTLVVAAAVFGFLAAIESGSQVTYEPRSCCSCVSIAVLLFFSFAFELAALGICASLYVKYDCKEPYITKFKDDSFKLVEGFILTCIACIGYLITFVIQCFA